MPWKKLLAREVDLHPWSPIHLVHICVNYFKSFIVLYIFYLCSYTCILCSLFICILYIHLSSLSYQIVLIYYIIFYGFIFKVFIFSKNDNNFNYIYYITQIYTIFCFNATYMYILYIHIYTIFYRYIYLSSYIDIDHYS